MRRADSARMIDPFVAAPAMQRTETRTSTHTRLRIASAIYGFAALGRQSCCRAKISKLAMPPRAPQRAKPSTSSCALSTERLVPVPIRQNVEGSNLASRKDVAALATCEMCVHRAERSRPR